MRIIYFLLLVLVTLSFFSLLVIAQSGCFTYEESPLYCQDIDMEEAQDECTLSEDCILEKVFSAGTACDNTKKFPGCQEVLCKSSCQLELAGRCTAGAVPEIKADEWCSAGCCKFVSSGQNYCSYKKSRWLCEIDAKNKNTVKFSFESGVNEKGCAQSCAAAPEVALTKDTEEITLTDEVVGPEELKIIPNLSTTQKTAITPKEEEGSSLFWWIFFSLLFIGVIFYLVRYTQLISLSEGINEVVRKESQDLSPEEEAEALKNISSFSVSPFISWLRPTRRKNPHKEKLKHRQEFFLETGLIPAKAKLDEFSRLKKLGGHHVALKVRTEKTSEKSAWERMGDLTAGKKTSSNVPSQKSVSPPAKTRSPAFDELRKMVKK